MSDKGFQAEQRALGALFMAEDPRALVLANGLTAEMFADSAHRRIFDAVLRAADGDPYGKAQCEDVLDDLQRAQLAHDTGGLQYLIDLATSVITVRNFGLDVDRMREARAVAAAVEDLRRAADKIEAGGDRVEVLEGVIDIAQAARASAGTRGALFKVVPVADLAEVEPPPVSFWWDGYMPAGVVTMLGAHGGTGKSTVALTLAVCITQGLPLFDVPTRRGRVAYFSGEDPEDLIRLRLRRICTKLDVDPADLDGKLFPLDATAFDPVLFHEVTVDARRMGTTTPAYADLRSFVAAQSIDVLIVDNASDTFDASEIDRSRVRAFMRSLARIAQERAGAVLLLAHVDKGTSRRDRSDSEGYSGSTAWHNSARSRLYLSRDKDGSLRLEHQKANLGRMREPLTLEWPEGGIPQLVEALSPVVQGISDRSDTRALLRLIADHEVRGEPVSTATSGPVTAVMTLRDAATYPARLRPGEAFELLRDAERRGLLQRVSYMNSQRKTRERWGLTAAGRDFAGLAQVAQVAQVAAPVETSATANRPAPVAQVAAPGGVGGLMAHTTGAEAA